VLILRVVKGRLKKAYYNLNSHHNLSFFHILSLPARKRVSLSHGLQYCDESNLESPQKVNNELYRENSISRI